MSFVQAYERKPFSLVDISIFLSVNKTNEQL